MIHEPLFDSSRLCSHMHNARKLLCKQYQTTRRDVIMITICQKYRNLGKILAMWSVFLPL